MQVHWRLWCDDLKLGLGNDTVTALGFELPQHAAASFGTEWRTGPRSVCPSEPELSLPHLTLLLAPIVTAQQHHILVREERYDEKVLRLGA